jgi:glycosyltransferase involved in cell wall biosynthesis
MSPVIWYIFPPVGGPGLGRYWRSYYLARAWQDLGADPIVIGPGYHHHFQSDTAFTGTQVIENVTYHFVPVKPYGKRARDRLNAIGAFAAGLMLDKGLQRLAAEKPPDVVIYSSPYPFGYVAAHRLARRHGARLVFEVRDLWPLSLTEIMGLPSWHPFVLASGICERFAYKTADHVVSLLANADEHMAARGLDLRKFAHIPNGMDNSASPAVSEQQRTPLLDEASRLAQDGKFLLLHAGNMSVTTHLEPLLDAALLLKERGRTDIRILLVGRGETEEDLKRQAQSHGLDNVLFFPQVAKAELNALLRICHAGYAALGPRPIYRFGYSLNKLFDYMSASLPVVFSCDLPGGLVERSGAGVRVGSDDRDALARAIADLADLPASARWEMGGRGRAFVDAEHDYRVLGRRYLDLVTGEGAFVAPAAAPMDQSLAPADAALAVRPGPSSSG